VSGSAAAISPAASSYSVQPRTTAPQPAGVGHGGARSGLVSRVDGVGQAGAGNGGDLRRAGEVGDELALVGAGGGGDGRPDGHRVAVSRGRLDRRDRADDRDAGLELGPQRAERVHGTGVAGEDDRVGLQRRRRPGACQRSLRDVVGRSRPPRHSVGVRGEHQVGVGAEPVQRSSGRQQPEPRVD